MIIELFGFFLIAFAAGFVPGYLFGVFKKGLAIASTG